MASEKMTKKRITITNLAFFFGIDVDCWPGLLPSCSQGLDNSFERIHFSSISLLVMSCLFRSVDNLVTWKVKI